MLCGLAAIVVNVLMCSVWGQAAENGLQSAIAAADLDLQNCTENPPNPRTEPYSVTDEVFPSFLRLTGPLPPHTLWRTGAGAGLDQHFRLAFVRPVRIGTIVAVTNGTFGVLKPNARYPGDPGDEADWQPLRDPRPEGEIRVLPLPPGLEVRALRVSFHSDGRTEEPYRSEIAGIRLLKGRYVNLAWDAVPLAGSEYGERPNEREAYGKQGLNDGRPGELQGGQWRNQPEQALSEESPEWAALLWEEPQRISAVGFVNAFAKTIAIDTYHGPADIHPLTAPPADWHEEARAPVPVPWRPAYSEFFVPFASPQETRCVRVRFIEGLTNENPDVAYHTKGEPVHARLGEFLALQDIGDQPLSVTLAGEPVEYEARMSDNRGQEAVPAPGPVKTDGDLSDWDTSGGISMCQDTSLLLGRAAAWGYAMYDADALYVAVDFTDPTPLQNQHDPASEPGLGWGGDCAQIRLQTDRVTHLTTWYSGAGDVPVMHVAYGADFDEGEIPNAVGRPGVELAFREHADGSGYVEEMRIPWSLITLDSRSRRAGDTIQLHYDLKWGTRDAPEVSFADNLAESATTRDGTWRSPATWGHLHLAEAGNLKLPLPPWLTPRRAREFAGPVRIRYNLPEPAPGSPEAEEGYEVTLVIDDAEGRRVRTLFGGAPRHPGDNVERWDGLDDLGKVALPGEYHWRAIYRAPLHLRYQFTVNHAGDPPWLSGATGGWLSDHAPPQAACAIGDKVFIGATVAEAGHTLLAVDLAGSKLWGTKWLNLAGAQTLATDGESLYVGSEGGWIGAKLQVNLVEPDTYRFRNVIEEGYENKEDLPGLVGLAIRDDTAYLALEKPGVIAIYQLPETEGEKGRRVGELPLPDPGGLAFDASGNLWAVSGKAVVRFGGVSGPTQPVITEHLAAPKQIAFDSAGNVYVSDGAPDHQVKVFAPDGRLLRAIGKPGGRKVGAYEPFCMDNPHGVAIDEEGRLWACEMSRQPKRVSLWSAEGKLLRAFHGPTRYGGSGYLDATDRTRLHDDGMTFKLDWQKGTWKLTDVHYRFGAEPGMIFERTPGRSWRHRGRTFLANYDYWTSRYLVLYERQKGGRTVPLAAAGRAEYLAGHTISGVAAWGDEEFAARRGGKELKDLNFLWSDLNRDGDQQPEEVHFFQTPEGGLDHWPWTALWSMWITEDCSFVVVANGNGPRQ